MRGDKREEIYAVCRGCPYSERCITVPGESVSVRRNCAEYQRFLSLEDTREMKLSDEDLKRLRSDSQNIIHRLNDGFQRG
ncbi:MAG TPA: hypothetical protein VI544_01240 [Candidatus Nanoarchaeia archaeon]|nr:hypothetical protein [Candidatus Nanoarchaeia archaeon]